MRRLRRAIKIIGPVRVAVALVGGAALTVLVAWWIALHPGVLPKFPVGQSGFSNSRFCCTDPPPGDPRDPAISTWYSVRGWANAWSRRSSKEQFIKLETATSQTPLSEQPPGERPAWIRGVEYGEALLGARYMYVSTNESAYGYPFKALANRQIYGIDTNQWPADQSWYLGTAIAPHRPVIQTGLVRLPDRVARTLMLIGVPFASPGTHAPASPIPMGFVLDTLFYAVPVYTLLSIPACLSGLRRRLTNRCHRCGYKLEGLTSDTCPECGNPVRVKPKKNEG
ncbi:MAG: hypothetical protein H6810_04395 [Phycisphaeraceae bacterium]|nr:MAG: hypothetical protein H6810_04395 [Phycisphaeraceae bacterium]